MLSLESYIPNATICGFLHPVNITITTCNLRPWLRWCSPYHDRCRSVSVYGNHGIGLPVENVREAEVSLREALCSHVRVKRWPRGQS